MISLYQLRTFRQIATTGSVREAAERLVVSQPAVSAALASLQRDLGAALVERSGRGIVVTAAGREVDRASSAASVTSGRVRLAVVTPAAEQLSPPMLKGFREQHSAFEVVVDVGNRSRVWERLERWEADLAIAGRTRLSVASVLWRLEEAEAVRRFVHYAVTRASFTSVAR